MNTLFTEAKAEFLGHPLWQYAEFGIYVAAAFVAALITNRIFAFWLKKLEARKGASWRQDVVRIARRPMTLLLFLWVLKHAAHVFEASPEITAMVGHIVTVVAAVAVTVAIFSGIELIASRTRHRLEPAEQVSYLPIITMAANCAKVFAIIVAIIMAAQNIGIEVGGLLTTLGIGGIATALAAQETLANFFGCITLFADRPFQVGERIKMDTLEGEVERIGLRSTRVRTDDGALVTVPNRTLAGAVIHNLSRRPARKD